MSDNWQVKLVDNLTSNPAETEWLEFKRNHLDSQQIGEYLSALANSACLVERPYGYLLFGVDDTTRQVVGTSFNPDAAKGVGNQDLLIWISQSLSPNANFECHGIEHPQGKVVLFQIEAARNYPVRFRGNAFIRIGSSKTELNRYPEQERALWHAFNQSPFETGVAAERQEGAAVISLLDYPAYFELLKLPLPETRDGVLSGLAADKLIAPCETGDWNITNLGAILFARKLADFPRIQRKAVRVVQYKGAGRTETLKEQGGTRGDASGFAGLISYSSGLIPAKEIVGQSLRENIAMFPTLAVRELVANALIHQDFDTTGTGPMVEIFDNRIEITSPGEPLLDTRRFLDNPPQSRNEALAALMRRFGICEERGSGIDKVVFQVELAQLPAPLFEAPPGFTQATLFAHRPFNSMDKDDRVRACYLHACLKRVMRDYLTNSSLRERLGIEQQNSAVVSRCIREAVDAGLVKPFDEKASRRLMKYLPFWA